MFGLLASFLTATIAASESDKGWTWRQVTGWTVGATTWVTCTQSSPLNIFDPNCLLIGVQTHHVFAGNTSNNNDKK